MNACRVRVGVAFLLFCAFACSSSLPFKRVDDKQIQELPSRNRFVVLHFWATWCQPCLVEIPTLNRLSKKFPSAHFIAINMDDVENEGAIPGFLKKHPIEYEVVLRQGKDFQSLAKAMDPEWKEGLPATMVFADGKRVFSKIGMVDEDELARTLQQLNHGS